MKKENEYNFENPTDFDVEMTEDEKINKLVETYRPYLDMTDMDICHSLKGRWYFFRYSKNHDCYEVFTEFETASELIEIVIGELCMDATFLIEEEYDIKPHLHCDLSDFMNQDVDYEDSVIEFHKHLRMLFELSSKTY